MAAIRSPKQRALEAYRRLCVEFPAVVCALDHRNAYELLAATILSAQCTDERVNMVTPALFARYPTPQDLASASQTDVETLVKSTGFYRNKAQNLIGMARGVCDRFGGDIPTEMDDLVTLPGVGRKTANVLRSVVFDLPGLPVDTHVGRIVRRLNITKELDAVKVEHVLNKMLPPQDWGRFSLRLILHGRKTCDARKPRCGQCVLADICPSRDLAG
jgi:endonuclease-3